MNQTEMSPDAQRIMRWLKESRRRLMHGYITVVFNPLPGRDRAFLYRALKPVLSQPPPAEPTDRAKVLVEAIWAERGRIEDRAFKVLARSQKEAKAT